MSYVSDELLHVPSLSGELPSRWMWCRLEGVCLGVYDCPHSTPVLTESGPMLARSQDIRSGFFRAEQAAHVSEATYRERVHRSEPRWGDLLYSREGTYFGIAAEVPQGQRLCLGQRMVLLRPNPALVNHRYLRYWLNSPAMKAHIEGHRDGSVAERLNLTTIRALPVCVPPLDTQIGIATILGALDDKIELNLRMNETLEAIARILFKSWFVDFDPVRAKMAGRHPAGMDAAIADLFPREISVDRLPHPVGWGTRSLYDSAIFINGAAYREFHFCSKQEGLPIVKIAELKAGFTQQTRFTNKTLDEKYRLVDGDILFSWSGNPDTSIDTFIWYRGPAWINQHIFKVIPNHDREKVFLFLLLKFLKPAFSEIARNKQTTGLGHVTAQDMKRMAVISPPAAILDAFNTVAGPLFNRWYGNLREITLLVGLRELLLPKLLSGELRVRDAEREIEKVA
jgi:type I restriction enzyme, S subunit